MSAPSKIANIAGMHTKLNAYQKKVNAQMPQRNCGIDSHNR